jgi:hypothetical protein
MITSGAVSIPVENSRMKRDFDNQFIKRAKEEFLDVKQTKELIPCSIEAFEHLDEMYLEGKNKLNEELSYA